LPQDRRDKAVESLDEVRLSTIERIDTSACRRNAASGNRRLLGRTARLCSSGGCTFWPFCV